MLSELHAGYKKGTELALQAFIGQAHSLSSQTPFYFVALAPRAAQRSALILQHSFIHTELPI